MDEISVILQLSEDKSKHPNQDKLVMQPFDYICKIPDQQILLKLLRAFNHWFEISSDKLSLIIEIIEMLQKASLLIDDIEDNSTSRQGSPVAHSIYGVASTINAATYVYCTAVDKILILDHPEAIKVFTKELKEVHRGQGMDIYWRDNFEMPTYLEYKLMAVQKLGSLFRLGARLMQLFSTKTIDISRLIVIIGMHFQIWDDYHSLGDDITEGKFGFPIIHAIQNEKTSGELLNILKQRTANIEIKKDCISRMQTLGSLKYTEDTLKSLDKEARKEMAKLGSNSLMDKLLNEFRSPKAATD